MLRILLFACMAPILTLTISAPAIAAGKPLAGVEVHAGASDPVASKVRAMAVKSQAEIEAWFGEPFPESVNLTLARDRAAFNAVFPKAWGMSQTECWMVGVGVADFLVVLSPSAWPEEACDHDAASDAEIQGIITHEMTHTFHGQANPTRDFTGMDDLGWLVEGLAVVVAGQLNPTRMEAARGEVVAHGGPVKLADVWSGKERYGLAGSLVDYVDATYGRQAIRDILPMTRQDEVLARLGVTEPELLANWKAWLLKS